MQTITLNAWGKSHKISFHLATYTSTGNLYIGLVTHKEDGLEPWSDLTVNLNVQLPPNRAYIDVGNNGGEIIRWLIDNSIGKPTLTTKIGGYCVYPEFEFNMPELMKYVVADERKVK